MNQEQEDIDFHVVRTLGEILNVSFLFIKENFKQLAMLSLMIGAPFALLQAYINLQLAEMITPETMGVMTSETGILSLLILLGSALTSSAVFTVVGNYISLYKVKMTGTGNVWAGVFLSMVLVFFTFFLYYIIIVVGLILLIIPGLYWMIGLSLSPVIALQEKISPFKAFQRSFALLNKQGGFSWEKFWSLFAMLLIVTILLVVLGKIVEYGFGVFGFVSDFHAWTGTNTRVYYLIYTFLNTLLGVLIMIIPVVVFHFQYFSYLEDKESSSIWKDIEKIGE